jgi:hypothetical protein
LLILVTKSDIWAPLLPEIDMVTEPIVDQPGGGSGVDVRRIEQVSSKLKALLQAMSPEFVAAASDVSQYVLYLPVSALGRSPRVPGDPSPANGHQPPQPRWVTAPILYTFAKWSSGLVPAFKGRFTSADPAGKNGHQPSSDRTNSPQAESSATLASGSAERIGRAQ